MKKIIEDKTIYFYDDENTLLMYIDHRVDDCIWYFASDNKICIFENTELYHLLNEFMDSNYTFSDEVLKNYKDENTLVWYSDCYYNPDDEWSIASVSSLTIKRVSKGFVLIPAKQIDELIDRKNKTYGICFSPAGNGKYSKNAITGLTLQDDFIFKVYQPLMKKQIVLNLSNTKK